VSSRGHLCIDILERIACFEYGIYTGMYVYILSRKIHHLEEADIGTRITSANYMSTKTDENAPQNAVESYQLFIDQRRANQRRSTKQCDACCSAYTYTFRPWTTRDYPTVASTALVLIGILCCTVHPTNN
jgi:hypothetical protein